MSADTVIYLGPCNNDETDGEHPPAVILPNLSYKGNQCTIVDVPENYPKPQQHPKRSSTAASRPSSSTKPEKFQPAPLPEMYCRVRPIDNKHPVQVVQQQQRQAPRGMIHADNIVMEQWVDGPRVARSKISEARHLKREVNRTKNEETWIDGPRLESRALDTKPPQLPALAKPARGYGFMDTHKKTMIRKWVENQTTEVLKISGTSHEEWQMDNTSESPRQRAGSRGTKTQSPDEDDQDSGPSDVPPALPLIDQSKSSKNSELDFAPTYPKKSEEFGGNDLLMTSSSHPLAALSFGNMSTVSSFHFEDVRIQQAGEHQGISK